VPLALGYVLPRVLITLRRERAVQRLMAAQVALNLALDLVLAPMLGAPGIALATALSYLVIDVAQWRVVRRELGSAAPPVVPELEHEDGPERRGDAAPARRQPVEQQPDA
jgi:peptidoglycan biosynthesis protein MviN/MurJ (putative lipid II flippase)